MDRLRTPFFVVSLVAMVLVVGIEAGTSLLPPPKVTPEELVRTIQAERPPAKPEPNVELLVAARSEHPPRPGLAIPYLALLDGLLLFTVALMGTALIIPENIQGRLQGVVTFILTLILIIAGILLIIAAFTLLMVMLGLFLAVPFGTIAYLAIWGFFDRSGASATLGIIFFLKLVFAVCLVLAHQRFLQNKGLVFLVLTSLLGSVIVSFLHGLVPGILVSLTDALAAIIVGILAVVWSLLFFLGSIKSVIKAIRLGKSSA